MFNANNIHKVFLSFHHQDDEYRQQFERKFSNECNSIFVNRSVQYGDIDPNNRTDTIRREIRDRFISDSTVTIVLIGSDTWKRKHVDWEIGYSLTQTSQNTRSGLIGILLPSYTPHKEYFSYTNCMCARTENGKIYTPCNIPPRLYDNIQSGYAKIYSYPFNAYELKQWIHEAFQRRNNVLHRNSRNYFANNRSSSHWE
ncbi:TPA: TIR domain-containing protein [Pasteurella multocida]|uniref:TIR domain-containing protein n=1 Tax=Pasteurella multocida TaxID=747 RepID=UPI0035F47691